MVTVMMQKPAAWLFLCALFDSAWCQALHCAIKEKKLFQVMHLLEKEDLDVNWANPDDDYVR